MQEPAIPANVAQGIRAKAAADWPGDYSMQLHQVEEQEEAYRKISEYRAMHELSKPPYRIAHKRARADWPDDYSMQLSTLEGQIAAAGEFLEFANKNIPPDVIDEIRERASSLWKDDYEMMLHELTEQTSAWLELNRRRSPGTETETRNSTRSRATPKEPHLDFMDVRLSKHFLLTDFLQSPAVWTSRTPLLRSDITDDQIEAGRHLCNFLLEPLIEALGPCSIAAGLCPTSRHGRNHPPDSPHFWSLEGGAAADVVFHDWVNEDKAPIKITEYLHQAAMAFDRLISYAGSEFLCLTYCNVGSSDPAEHRSAVMENIRIPGDKHKKTQWSHNHSAFMQKCGALPPRPDWRRSASELPSNSPELRPHHVRTGRYFTLLDFCRSPNGYSEGRWVIPSESKEQIAYARMASEILDPLVRAIGRISVTRGVMPDHLAALEKDADLWRWQAGRAAVEFVLPEGTGPQACEAMLTHRMIEHMESSVSSLGDVVRVIFQPFSPSHLWSSAVDTNY